MTPDTTYNGWTNYETWNIPLWVDNDYGTYQARISYLPAHREWSAQDVYEFVHAVFPDGTPDLEGDRNWSAKVNWPEIAEHWQADHLEHHGRK